MQIDDIRRVLVVGAGTMGEQIALQCAAHGYDVALYDVDAAAIERARAQQARFLDGFVAAGRMAREQADRALERIAGFADMAAACADADLAVEAVPERPELKAEVFVRLNALCPPRAIFTTNTSFLVPSMFAEASGRPGQLAAMHFHLPVWVSNVVDVMPHPGTAPEVVELLHAFARRIGQIPIRYARETHGYIFNAMLGAINREALTLVANGIASFEDVDRSWMGVMKMAVGPFGIMDSVGLETVYAIVEYWAALLHDQQAQRNAALLRRLLDEGRGGVKSGRGFYSYPDPAYRRPGFVEGE